MQLNTKDLNTIPKDDYPIFADGIYFCKIKEAKVEPSKSGNGKLLKIQLVPSGDTLPLRSGSEIKNNGRIIFDMFSLTPTENYDPDRKLAEIANAINLKEGNLSLESLLGQWVKIKLGYKPEKDSYPEANKVNKYLPITEADGFNG